VEDNCRRVENKLITRRFDPVKKKPANVVFILGLMSVFLLAAGARAQTDYNTYDPAGFPAKVSGRVFEIRLAPERLLAVVPSSLEPKISDLATRFKERCGVSIIWKAADAVQADELRGKDLILAGNIMDNRWLLEMYMKRRAYADAYFPGKGGYIVHPAKSVWDEARNVMVIGVSSDGDIEAGVGALLDRIEPGAKSIGVVRLLKTAHRFPVAPESIEPDLGPTIRDLRERPPYMTVAEWGLNYFFTGDKKWAALFRDGMSVLHRRAETSGKWITESWSNVYFILWNLFHSWELIDDDPFFSVKDRGVIEDVLWGYTRYIEERPYLDADLLPLDEPRQNHSTFLALSLDAAYRYYTGKYSIKGLQDVADKVRRCFDHGQALCYRPNDDGGSGYQVLAPSHYLYYALGKGDLSYLESGRLRTLVDLIAATTDNRGDPVTFGDIGNYAHRRPGSPMKEEAQFPSVAAWFYKDGAYQWLYDWLAKDSSLNLSPRGPLGAGLYATDLGEAPPTRFTGILPVILDDAALRWSSRRSAGPGELPLAGARYFDKISFRKSFDPQDEYLLLDGTSTFAHGHQDGNTVTRLTWKDRVWLADCDYIKDGPQEHNGVSVVRDGVQDPPPPLNRLDTAANFEAVGATETTATGFNGADWQRRIIWKKGGYFLFLDRIVAREPGAYRLENRWRLRGDVTLDGNTVTVRQGDRSFFIRSADEASRALKVVPDDIYSRWDYPYGPAATTVCLATRNIGLPAESSWVFANLMYATAEGAAQKIELRRAGKDLYVIDDAGARDFVGLDSRLLEKAGILTDCSLFVQSAGRLYLLGLGRLTWGKTAIAASARVDLSIDLATGAGILLNPEEGDLVLDGVWIEGLATKSAAGGPAVRLKPGRYDLRLSEKPAGDGILGSGTAGLAAIVQPAPTAVRPVEFGLGIAGRVTSAEEITAAGLDGDALIFGTAAGSVYSFREGSKRLLFNLPDGKRVLAIKAADINGDGRREIVSSDSDSHLFCHDAAGALLWKLDMTPFYGKDASATEIAVDDIDGRGAMTILAGTIGWKLYAVYPDGKVRWESFIYYHPLTRIKVLKNKSRTVIAVGTIYQTPLNVVDPVTGVVIWKTWEQTGSETMSTTDYCGKVLRDMVFIDTDGDGDKEIVFGNESHSVYAMNAADGKTKWKAQVGDKVSAMRLLGSGTAPGERILTTTEAGEVYIFDRRGHREMMKSLGSGITGLEVIRYKTKPREDVLLSTEDGRVAVYDADFIPRASLDAGIGRIQALFLTEVQSGEPRIFAVGAGAVVEVRYKPYFLRLSRHY
jgi:outer membrane protein assembly factor BamB